jgi:hypothetical protein
VLFLIIIDPCQLVWQVKEFVRCCSRLELLHLPDEPAGVGTNSGEPS